MPGFADAFAALQERTENFEGLRKGLSQEMVEAAIALRGQAKVRHRKLPPETVLWLVIGLCLFRNKSLFAVAETLKLWVDGRPAAAHCACLENDLGLNLCDIYSDGWVKFGRPKLATRSGKDWMSTPLMERR